MSTDNGDDRREAPPRPERLRALLQRIGDLTEEQFGARAPALSPPDPAGLPDLGDRFVPAEVTDLYSVTGGGEAYGYLIVGPADLGQAVEQAEELMEELALDREGDLPWGPAPVGHSLPVLMRESRPVYVAELDGEPSGVTLWDAGGDEGYRWVAPSLERLFETWVALTEAGLGNLNQSSSGASDLGLREDELSRSRARDICQQHSCSPVAGEIW